MSIAGTAKVGHQCLSSTADVRNHSTRHRHESLAFRLHLSISKVKRKVNVNVNMSVDVYPKLCISSHNTVKTTLLAIQRLGIEGGTAVADDDDDADDDGGADTADDDSGGDHGDDDAIDDLSSCGLSFCMICCRLICVYDFQNLSVLMCVRPVAELLFWFYLVLNKT